MRGSLRRALMVFCSVTIAGCDMAPAYKPERLVFPDNWSGQGVMRYGRPSDGAPRSDWWTSFGDQDLNRLEERAMAANADLQAAAERFTQSRDVAAEAESHLYPQLGGMAGGTKYKGSKHRLWRGAGATGPVYMSSEQYQASVTWEPDFWSSIRNRNMMARQSAQQSAADYAVARLGIQAELAQDYIRLRGLDALEAVYNESIRYYKTAVEITKLRLSGAIAAGLDVSRAETQLFSTQAALTDVQARRAVMEHAIAVLVNAAPASFHIAPRPDFPFRDVRPAPALPSALLERRPDIAAAERTMAQANRAIGVSRAAFYPHVTFNAMTGFMDNGFDLASLGNSMYQYGAQAVLQLFQGGLRRAELQRTWSYYRQTEDDYRATVLEAFQETEDSLTNVSKLRTETGQHENAVHAALRTQSMTMQLYTGGLTNYLDVVVAQQAALVAQIAFVETRTRQTTAVVDLIRALGGGWSRSDLPKTKDIRPFSVLQYEGLHKPKPVRDVPQTDNLSDAYLLWNPATATGQAATPR
ncbi:efflux transporter outer membrane subunit [Acetobacter sp. AN02]|uniref:efflux transporter outer membrane subunit n=1 Tax=Acetobacter sp. AN02 TaxID=2894186 RepID=UPI0024346667|nr:efflux transporter outer membrane subunit [Acetobacter sp. AN02]MDG6095130.1 efflux transporter outer membrane subunit [Acetobacter sp. AN02]